MKHIVVVVRSGMPECTESFKGKNIVVINKSARVDVSSLRVVGPELLIVKDDSKQLAVFRDWTYWRQME